MRASVTTACGELGQRQSRSLRAPENNRHAPNLLDGLGCCQPTNLPIERPSLQTIAAREANLHELMVPECAFDLGDDAVRDSRHPNGHCGSAMMREATQIATLFAGEGHDRLITSMPRMCLER